MHPLRLVVKITTGRSVSKSGSVSKSESAKVKRVKPVKIIFSIRNTRLREYDFRLRDAYGG